MALADAGKHVLIKYALEAVYVSYLTLGMVIVCRRSLKIYIESFFITASHLFPFRVRVAEGLCY